jgi:hypothetical protein
MKTMQYLLLIYENEARWATMNQASQSAEIAEYCAFGKEFAEAIKGGNALQPTSTARTVRARNGRVTVTDGPFAETKEQLGGFYLVEAPDIEQAAAMAAKFPDARYGCVEVRPIMQVS